jgi:hypothetical protein
MVDVDDCANAAKHLAKEGKVSMINIRVQFLKTFPRPLSSTSCC